MSQEIISANDLCSRCGRKGHFIKNCYAKNYINGDVIDDELDESSKKSTGSCYRCGRKGHYSNDCYASTHSKGYKLD